MEYITEANIKYVKTLTKYCISFNVMLLIKDQT